MIYILCTALCYREGQRRPDSTHLRSSRWPGWDLWGGLGLGSRSLALLADRLLSGTTVRVPVGMKYQGFGSYEYVHIVHM